MTLNGNSFLIFTYIFSAGICVMISIQSAMIGLGDANKIIYRYFSLLTLTAAVYLGATVNYYVVASIESAVLALKIQTAAACVAYPFFIKFIEVYTGSKSSRLLTIVLLLVGIQLIINFLSPFSLRFSSLEQHPSLVLPWGEALNQYSGQLNPYRFFITIGFFIFSWGVIQGFRQYQRGERLKGALLSISLMLMLVGAVWGALIDYGFVRSFYIVGFTFLFLVMVMNWQLTHEYKNFTSKLEMNIHELEIAASTFEAHDAIMILGADLFILRVNKSIEKFTGYKADELIGNLPHFLQTEKYNAAFYDEIVQILLQKGGWTGHLELKHKGGRIYPAFANFTLIKDSLGYIKNVVCIYNDLSEIKKAEEYLCHIQNIDQLTGLLNRKSFIEKLGSYLAAPSAIHEYGALVFINLDNFKSINDTFGHGCGDLLLLETAFRLKELVNKEDLAARLGGDEFVIFLKNIGTNEKEASYAAADFAERALAAIAVKCNLALGECYCTASIGVTLSLGNIKDPFELIKCADIAMTRAEELGRNCVQFFEKSLQENIERQTHLQFDLHNAIKNNQLELYYQLQVNQDLNPVGAEALIRWNHPELGLIPPSQFISLAEETLLIKSIGSWILHAACKQLVQWSHQSATKNLKLSVNVSAIQLMDPDFVDQVKIIIQEYEIDPSYLKFEITESIAIENTNSVIEKLLRLKQKLGIQISIDDFGTGYSSLAQLKNLPIDEIKIDLSFTRNITKNKTDEMMVKTIIDLGKNLNFDIVAEGVEYKEQFNLLKMYGCNKYQGYLFAKPLAIDDFDMHVLNFKHQIDSILLSNKNPRLS